MLSLAVTSPIRTLPELDRYADNYIAQRLSQMPGVGLVDFHGEQKPAVRVQIDPDALAARGLTLEDVRSVIGVSTLDQPKGSLDGPARSITLGATDQLLDPQHYRDQVIAYKNGMPIKLGDLGRVIAGAEDTQQAAQLGSEPTVIVDIHKQPGFNLLSTIATLKAKLPELTASLPRDVQVQVVGDRTQTIEASVNDMQFTLLLSIALVVVVVSLCSCWSWLGPQWSMLVLVVACRSRSSPPVALCRSSPSPLLLSSGCSLCVVLWQW